MMLLPEAKIDVVVEKTRADMRYDISRRFISPVINKPKGVMSNVIMVIQYSFIHHFMIGNGRMGGLRTYITFLEHFQIMGYGD